MLQLQHSQTQHAEKHGISENTIREQKGSAGSVTPANLPVQQPHDCMKPVEALQQILTDLAAGELKAPQ